jgi:surface polysaccharide O-acyltransferase-like enzyme
MEHHPFEGTDYYDLVRGTLWWCVPVFVMISGALFLKSFNSLKKLYFKNILRIVVALVFWSVVYAIVNNKGINLSISFFGEIADGFGHCWFLFMILGLYIVVPILKRIVDSQMITKYFLALSFLFTFLIPRLLILYTALFGREASIISKNMNELYLYLPLGYTGYYVLGYYLQYYKVSKKVEVSIYMLALLTVFFNSFFVCYNFGNNIIRRSFPLGYLTPIVLIQSVAIFLFFKNNIHIQSPSLKRLLSKLSRYTFGVYLVHIIIMNLLFDDLGITNLFGYSILSMIMVSIITFLLSLFISGLINKIPILNRYII